MSPGMMLTSPPSALFEAVRLHPADMRLRGVLADALIESGDPRGEFIALQLARHSSGERATPREGSLLAEHRDAWLGRLAGLVHQPRFERGFLHAAQVRRETALPATVERFDEWATVGNLDVRFLPEALEVRLLGAPSMRSLREVSGLSLAGLSAISKARGALPWRALSLQGGGVGLAALLRCPLPLLTSLTFFDQLPAPRLRELLESALGRQLTHLAFKVANPVELPELLTLALRSTLETMRASSTGGELTFEVAQKTLRAPRKLVDAHPLELPWLTVVVS
jgi:uncharacterized protein (TIGR02996 family)